MPRVNLIGASNRLTNNTCEFGSMAGLAPTTNVRPNVTGLPGYKVTLTAGNQHLEGPAGGVATTLAQNTTYRRWGCGLGIQNACPEGTKCLKNLNLFTGSNTIGTFATGRSRLLG
jgi:hypothetical protein|tara:strand:- start:192 stop:536 length:345 start_codon:yes stop_codon:yes gene_type:complete